MKNENLLKGENNDKNNTNDGTLTIIVDVLKELIEYSLLHKNYN